MKQYDFKNKAIKCDTWEQVEQLAEIARGVGFTVDELSPKNFPEMPYFCRASGGGYLSHYSTYEIDETLISFTDFINS